MLGLRTGLLPFAPDARMKGIPVEATRVGDATARAIFYRYRYPNAVGQLHLLLLRWVSVLAGVAVTD